MSLVMNAEVGYFPRQTHEKSRAGFRAGSPAAEPGARVARGPLAARPAIPARTSAIAPRPARDRYARGRNHRLPEPATAGLPCAGGKPGDEPGRPGAGRAI